jgi:predicted DNA-binding protein (MmcQ/YjbR family)
MRWQDFVDQALRLPETRLDEPWEGDVVVKVRAKVFAFCGSPESERPGVGLKLPESAPEVLATVDGATPSAYGLGRHGWVVIPLDAAPDEHLLDWLHESYLAVAPKTVGARVVRDAGVGGQGAVRRSEG